MSNGISLRDRIGVINGLRGLAILGVIYHHLFWQFTNPGNMQTVLFGYRVPYSMFLSNGWLAVNVFFILSGFVLYYPYAQGRRELGGMADIGYFFQRRIARLYPLFLVNILVCTLLWSKVSAVDIVPVILETASALFHFTNWMPREVNWVLWSLGIEIWFSLMFPFVVLALWRIGFLPVLTAIFGIAFFVRLQGAGIDYPNPYINPVKDNVFGRLDDFLVGMLVCHVYVHGRIRFPVVQIIAGILVMAAGCFLWDMIALKQVPAVGIALANNVIQLATVLLMFGLLGVRQRWIRWLFDNWPLQILGLMTYSLYVWHGVSMGILKKQFTPETIASYFLVLFVFSALTYRYVEFSSERDWRKLFLLGK